MYKKKVDFAGEVLEGYVDFDYAANLDTKKSQYGYVFYLYGSAISWRSCLQSVVALSTTEAEYMAITEATNDVKWLRGIVEDFGIMQNSVTIHCDSQSALHLAKHNVFHERSKHIDVRLHLIKDEVNK